MAERTDEAWRALGEHFYAAACGWALTDDEPPEALVLDRFYVAAQDWIDRENADPSEPS